MKTVMTMAALLVLVPQAASADSVLVEIPIERETILASPHKKNNDGAWAYGWIRVTGRMLLGFDVTPLDGRAADVQSATLKLFVAQNHFNSTGAHYDLHPFDPTAGVDDWEEGNVRFNTFSYCQTGSIPPLAVSGPGATWNCSIDPDPLSAGTECQTSWTPDPNLPPLKGYQPHKGFKSLAFLEANRFPDENTTEEKKLACDQPVQPDPNDDSTCNPSCSDSLECFGDGTGPNTADDCWRAVRIDVTTDIQEALAATPPHLTPSWLLKRREEVDTTPGAFHFFSREGAICKLGCKDPDSPFKALRPVLEVVLTEQPGDPPEIPEPDPHCEDYPECES